MDENSKKLENEKQLIDEGKKQTMEEDEIFDPVLGEIVSDDSFSFTLLSCHCSGSVPD